jgi:hypothetical protein
MIDVLGWMSSMVKIAAGCVSTGSQAPDYQVKQLLNSGSMVAFICVLLSGCGGGGTGSSGNTATTNPSQPSPTSTPTPPAVAPFVELKFAYEVHRFGTKDTVPPYTYAGVNYPGGVADIFPQASISVDFERDRYPEVVVPLSKAYGTPAYAALPYLLLSNSNGRLRYDATVNAQLPSVFGARRAASLNVAGNPSAFFVAHNVSGFYNDPKAHGSAVLLGRTASGIGAVTNAFPRLTTKSELPDNAVDAHAMAVGDINGDGLDDILIGNWFGSTGSPVILQQQSDGRFSLKNDPFLERLLSAPMVNPKSDGNEGNNLLLDLHLVDINGDKLADLIAGYGHGATPSLLFINRNGRYNFDERIALPPSIYGIDTNLHLETRSLDIDNDGDLDILIQHSRYVPYYGGNYLQLLRNDQGVFTDITASALSQDQSDIRAERLNWSPDVFIRDLDGDRLVDIVYGLSNGRLLVFFNQGGGRFTRLTTALPRNEMGRLLEVGDFDADGKQELVYYQHDGSATEKTYIINVYKIDFQKP